MSSGIYDMLGPEGFGSYEVDWDAGMALRRVSRSPRGLLIPGFVDLHIHGGFGIDFMSASPEEMRLLCHRLTSEGYEAFLPTTITAPPERVAAAIANLPDHPLVAGFHLEGPFISPKYPGAQPKEFIANAIDDLEAWEPILDDPRLRVVTLAPEIPGALELTASLLRRGVIVSLGHTNATFDEARRGFEFGASHATHMFNAMRPLHHREAGTVGYALTNDSLTCELIYDRHHVARQAAALLLKCKPADRVIAVSDGTLASGTPAGVRVDMWGQSGIVGRGQVRLEDGTLAGSAITLLNAFQNLHDDFGPEVAIRLCCLNPRRALKMDVDSPKVWLELDRNLQLVKRHAA